MPAPPAPPLLLPLLLPPLLLPLPPPPVLAPAPGPGPGLGATAEGCGSCEASQCPSSACVVPGLRARNACGCCVLCLRLGGDPRGCRDAVGARARRCRQSLACASRRRPGGPDPQASRSCLCRPAGTACGPDGRWCGGPRALRLRIRHRRAARRRRWGTRRRGTRRRRFLDATAARCQPVPTIILSPQKIHNITRAQVYPSCDTKAVSTAVGTWRKIDQLMKEDEGVYRCHVANTAGEAHADGSITVLEQNRNKEAYLLAQDNPA